MPAQNEIGVGAASAAAMETSERARAATRDGAADYQIMRDALAELLECANLRGDNELPHPADDPKLWTARMQDAWSNAQDALDETPDELPALSAPTQPVPEEVRRALEAWGDRDPGGPIGAVFAFVRTLLSAQPTKPTGEDAGATVGEVADLAEILFYADPYHGTVRWEFANQDTVERYGDIALSAINALRPATYPAPALIPAGYRLISAEMTPTVMERMAFNLTGEFGADFVAAHREFALAVYAEAYASGFAPAPIPADEAEEAAYRLGKEEGASEAVQRVAERLGLDSEYRWSTDPERRQGGPVELLDKIVEHVEGLAAALARPSAPGEGLRDWLVRRIEAAEKDAAAHPEGHSNRCFYEAQTIAYENALSALSRPDTAGERRRPNADDLARWLVERAMLDRVPAEFAARALLERDDSPLRASPRPDTAGDGEGWRPILTAPKDGTVVDLSKDGARFTDFRWDAEQRGGGAWSRATHEHRHWRDRVAIYAPDHWMARPAMPAAPSDPRLDRAAPSSQGEG